MTLVDDVSITPSGAFALIVALVVLTFVVFYALLAIFALVIGWRRLAREYPPGGRLPLARYRGEGAIVGRYGWTAPPLVIALDENALVLIPRLPFRPAFGVVAIPWDQIVATERRRYHFFDVYRLTLAHGAKGRKPLMLGILPTPAAERIEANIAAYGRRDLDAPVPS